MKEGYQRKLLRAKLRNYTSDFLDNLNKIHPDTKAKFNIPGEEEEFLLDDYLDVFVSDIREIRDAYISDKSGKALEKLWNGAYNYNIED